MAEEIALEIHDLTVSYNKKPALWDVDFNLPSGVLAGIMGPNGSGKSTLLKTTMGLIEAASGFAKIFDKPVHKVRKRVSYVPQRESVDWDFPASALDVVLMGTYGRLGLFKRPRKADKEVAIDSLRLVGMNDLAQRQISQLSGGQQQRVFLARALAQQADIYFMDEPFAGVDIATEKTIISLLKKMTAKGKTVVVVHHDLHSATEYFDWLVLLNLRLVACGPTSDIFKKENLEQTYGGKLSLLTEVGELIKEKKFISREKDN